MQRNTLRVGHALTLMVIAGLFAFGSAHADKPTRFSDRPDGKNRQKDKHDRYVNQRPDHNARAGGSIGRNDYFLDRHRTVIHNYYIQQSRSGHCPPGLAKKRNGCLPPGQVRKWQIGRQLPRDVIFYDLPPSLVQSLGPAPRGYRYVRVASDILLITIGTGMIMDAIQDLGRM
jgi:Ni/Co efflux regulator RcnB